jgi:hypothetical protein
MKPLKQINRVEDPGPMLRSLEKIWLPKTAYYSIVLQNSVTYTITQQDEAARDMCSSCTQTCCINANHLHAADVLRFYYSGLDYMIPVFVPLLKGPTCSKLGDRGCTLIRSLRPLICISFFCQRAAEKYTDLYLLGKGLRAAMEALTKLYLSESGKIGKKEMARQIETLKQFTQQLVEYRNERRA